MKESTRHLFKAVGSILNIAPNTDYAVAPREFSDTQQLARDWVRIGKDCHHALNQYAAESASEK